jgi:hypothetical protein
MLAQVFAPLFCGSLIAIAVLGHVLLAEALLGPNADQGLQPRANNRDAPAADSQARTLQIVTLEATQSC